MDEHGYPGVYVPPDNSQLSLLTMAKIVEELNTRDNFGLRERFTEHALAEHDGDRRRDDTAAFDVSGEFGGRGLLVVLRRSQGEDDGPSNVGLYAIGDAPRTESGDSAAEQALFAWADSFDVDASIPPGIFMSE